MIVLKTKNHLFSVRKESFYRANLNIFLGLLLFSIPISSHAFRSSECDELPITIIAEHLGQIELPSILCGQEVYFSVSGLFDFLKIRNFQGNEPGVLEGFIKEQDDLFKIDQPNNQIFYRGETFVIAEGDLLRTKTELFLNARNFSHIFGLKSNFSLRNLAALLEIDFELPSVKAARREQMRANIRKVQEDILADTVLLRERPLIHFGTAAWNVHSTQVTNRIYSNRFNLGLGGLLAGGEFLGTIDYSTEQKFLPRNQFYRWRYVDNENTFFKQITAGKIGTKSIASLFNPVVGVQLSNAPTQLKKAFGTHILADYTNPDWMVELYINNVLVDYKQADASGFFSFEVPLMYGNTNISLRFYGPWGEEEVSERHLNIPYNFLPAGEFQYILTSGLVEDGDNTLFAQGSVNYGFTNRISLGAGVEYLSSLENNPLIHFINTSVRLPGNMLISAEYWHEVGHQANFSYTGSSQVRLDLNYTRYEKEQQAVRYAYLEKRRISLSHPLRLSVFSGTSRLILRQHLLRSSTVTNLEWLVSGSILGIRMNLANTAFFNDFSTPFVFSRLSTSLRLPAGFIFSPQVDYEYLDNRFTSLRGELRKHFSKDLHFQVSYDHNFKSTQFHLNAGLTVNLDFARIGFNSSSNRSPTSFSQIAGGSVHFDPSQSHARFDDRAVIGRGSVLFLPFLDINGNGKKDGTEPQLEGLGVQTRGGGMMEQIRGGGILFSGLEPYLSYNFQLDPRNLDRIAWQMEHETLKVFVNPSQVRVIKVAIKVVGEVAGFVLSVGDGIGGIKVDIYDSDDQLVRSIISEGDGYFSYLGLKSGTYTAQVDKEQLKKLDMSVNHDFQFSINNTDEGDFVDHLEFLLTDLEK